MKTRLQNRREKDSLKQATKYLVLALTLMFIIVRFGLPALIKMAGFIGDLNSSRRPIETQSPLPLFPPKLNPLPEATNSSQINIRGLAQAGTTIKLFVRGVDLEETIVATDGQFEFKNIHLADGNNEIYTETTNNQGLNSQASETLTIIVDSQAPLLEIASPTGGQRFFDKDNPITVSGKTDPETNLMINNRFGLVKDDGSFSLTLNLNSGDNQIDIIAKDAAGNETKKILTVNYTP